MLPEEVRGLLVYSGVQMKEPTKPATKGATKADLPQKRRKG